MKELSSKPTGKIFSSELSTYRKVSKEEYDKYTWEMVLVMKDNTHTIGQVQYHSGAIGNDMKYSRYVICREHKVFRSLTISEFYGNSVVD